MKMFTTTALLALLATLTAATPAPQGNYFEALITFQGAAGAQFTEFVPTDGSVFYISMHPFPALPLNLQIADCT
jgi:hypothetical protein